MSKRITIRDIAGFCPEEAIWKMIADISNSLLSGDYCNCLTPDSIIVDRDSFIINNKQDNVSEFLAPEQKKDESPNEKELIWSLGAIIFFAATGHVIFGGYGCKYQKEHPTVPLPVLPKGLQSLTSVTHKCLLFNPNKRIEMKELNNLARKELLGCCKQRLKRVDPIKEKKIIRTNNNIGEKWPEEMVEI